MSVPVWLTGFPSSITNRLTWRISAALAASLALVAVVLTLRYPMNAPSPTREASNTPVSHAARPQITDKVAVPDGHLGRLISFCSSMVTVDRSFVVFSNGTCVIVNEPSSDPIAEAVSILGECSSPNARFITKEIEHGNVLVTYHKPAFHCLFEDEIRSARPKVDTGFQRYLTVAERSRMTPDWEPPFHAKLGLLARHRLNEDATHLQVAKVIKARPIETGAPAPDQAVSSQFPELER